MKTEPLQACYRLAPFGPDDPRQGTMVARFSDRVPRGFVAIAWRLHSPTKPTIVYDEMMSTRYITDLDRMAALGIMGALGEDTGCPEDWARSQYQDWQSWREQYADAVAALMGPDGWVQRGWWHQLTEFRI